MDDSKAQRYLEIMRGFSEEEKNRLPLEYNLYATDFQKAVAKFAESGLRLDAPEIETLDRLFRELGMSMERQISLSSPWRPPLILLPRDRRKIRAQRRIVQQSLKVQSESLHRRILQEYFFLTNFLDVVMLVQTSAAEALGGVIPEVHLDIYRKASGRLVQAFQDADARYEEIQTLTASLEQGVDRSAPSD